MPRRSAPAALLLLALAARAGPEAAPAPDPAWQALLGREISAREYEARPADGGLQAPNRAHDLRVWFEPTGVRVHGRTAPARPRLVDLRLARLGREPGLEPALPGELTSRGARVEIRRPGVLEWYVNSPAGLEQGFTLAERPPGPGPLVLELRVVRGARGIQRRRRRARERGGPAAPLRRARRARRRGPRAAGADRRRRRRPRAARRPRRRGRLPDRDRSAAHGDRRCAPRVGPGRRPARGRGRSG